MNFKIGDTVYKKRDPNNGKEYTISAVHDYGFHTPPKLTIWMIDKEMNNYTANSDQIYIKWNILFRFIYWVKNLL